ncbi:2-amino-3-carboxymuconate-6-semialdehyde decarboxylase [Pseudonocardia sp. Ae717_Ps2]|uniref:amidohydrolase family protein n=3 Tax=Pseudonocardia TaxID=1847 RepID=UPI0005BD15ED|nr:amidohydrolase family protein [Pseudonocardia sp. Ae717_Ps2]OLM30145.1 2-amino-3-carboxymuconate-6-semialdehyde decarboxylase [Pseudonocardia sp. Ae717_Ps2]
MRIIALEEHFLDLDVARASRPEAERLSPGSTAAYAPGTGYPYTPAPEVLLDLGEGRIADMDAHGISVQVLSTLSTQQLPADVAVELVRKVNDRTAAAVAAHPDRFAAFAALPTAVPEAAADELARAVGELGFVGSMINGRTGGGFLDEPRFDPVLRRSAELRVPIYLHPGVPPVETSRSNYEGGLDPIVTARLQTSAWGWHVETGTHFLHLVLAGVFDRYPDLQLVLGHWGEMVPFYLERIEEALPQRITHLDRPVGDYFRENVHITPSGMFNQAQLRFCVETVGVDRIMFSVDYPMLGNDGARAFLREADLPPLAMEKIAHLNAERLLGLPG